MRTEAAATSIRAYHVHVPGFKERQHKRIVDYLTAHGPSTIGEIAKGLGMEKSTVSGRQKELRDEGFLVFASERKCSISGIRCKPLWFPAIQMGLFQ